MERGYVESPLGPLEYTIDELGGLVSLLFRSEMPEPSGATEKSEAARNLLSQLEEYFAGSRLEFDLPLNPAGTAFQRSVWEALLRIPFGVTRSYTDIAREIGLPAAVRAVGAANGANPIAIIVPCHRVIGASGRLTGYAGGLPIKEWLLRHEGALAPALAL